MDRTNISILLSTALLGVLLYVVRQFGNTGLEAVTPPARDAMPRAAAAGSTRVVATQETMASALPIVDGPATLGALLDSLGLDADAAINATRQWYEARGFFGANPLLGINPDSSVRDYYGSLDEATLEVMSRDNDMGATHELAARTRLTDAFGALELFQRAAEQGSVNALLQMASLQETLADVRPEDFAPDRDYARKLSRVGGRDTENNLRYQAFVSAVTAMRDGGEPVTDDSLLEWVSDLAGRNPAERVRMGCNQSFGDFIALGSTRRAAGFAPINTTPPPVFMAGTDTAARLPCQNTLNPIVSTLELEACLSTQVLDGSGALRLLYVCTSN